MLPVLEHVNTRGKWTKKELTNLNTVRDFINMDGSLQFRVFTGVLAVVTIALALSTTFSTKWFVFKTACTTLKLMKDYESHEYNITTEVAVGLWQMDICNKAEVRDRDDVLISSTYKCVRKDMLYTVHLFHDLNIPRPDIGE